MKSPCPALPCYPCAPLPPARLFHSRPPNPPRPSRRITIPAASPPVAPLEPCSRSSGESNPSQHRRTVQPSWREKPQPFHDHTSWSRKLPSHPAKYPAARPNRDLTPSPPSFSCPPQPAASPTAAVTNRKPRHDPPAEASETRTVPTHRHPVTTAAHPRPGRLGTGPGTSRGRRVVRLVRGIRRAGRRPCCVRCRSYGEQWRESDGRSSIRVQTGGIRGVHGPGFLLCRRVKRTRAESRDTGRRYEALPVVCD